MNLKKLLIIPAVGVLGMLSIAAAAELNVQGGVIQEGSDNNMKCTAGAHVAGWGLETDDDLVYNVRFDNINDNCAGAEIFAIVTADGSTVKGGPVEIPTDGGTGDLDGDAGEVGVRVSLGSAVSAEDITDLRVFIEGGAN